MTRLLQRTSLLYGLLALALLLSSIAACAAIALLIIDNGLSRELHAVAAEVPAGVRESANESFDARASRIMMRTRRAGIEVSVQNTLTSERVQQGFGADQGPPPGSDDSPNGGPGHDGPPPDDPGEPPNGMHGPPGGRGPPSGFTKTRQTGDSAPFVLAALFAVPSETVAIPGGSVTIAPSAQHLRTLAARFFFVVGLALSIALATAIPIGHLTALRTLRPLQDVVAELRRFGSGDFAVRNVDSTSAAGYEEVADAYNAATAQVLGALNERAKAEADMRRFIADAAHELRTPLTVLTGYFELLRGGVDKTSEAHIFDTIGVESRRMRDLISNLLTLARLDAPHVEPFEVVNLSAIVEKALDDAPLLAKTNSVHVDIRTGATILCDPGEMYEAVSNLLSNAAKHAPGSTLYVSLKHADDSAFLDIADDGPGMTSKDRDNAFRRFYRGEAIGDVEGSGLGLSIVERVITRARGTVALVTAPGAGTRFTIVLPLAH